MKKTLTAFALIALLPAGAALADDDECRVPRDQWQPREAVMQLELAGQKMVVFRNEGHGGVNVVYRREDGNIGWIDPRNSK